MNTEKKHVQIRKITIAFIIISVLLIIFMFILHFTDNDISMNGVFNRMGNTIITIFTSVLVGIIMIRVAEYGITHLKIKIPDYIKNTYPCPSNKVSCEKENIAFEFVEVDDIILKQK